MTVIKIGTLPWLFIKCIMNAGFKNSFCWLHKSYLQCICIKATLLASKESSMDVTQKLCDVEFVWINYGFPFSLVNMNWYVTKYGHYSKFCVVKKVYNMYSPLYWICVTYWILIWKWYWGMLVVQKFSNKTTMTPYLYNLHYC